MKSLIWGGLILGAVFLAVLSDTVATMWAKGDNKFSFYLPILFALGPLVFISFGLVTTKSGLAIASATVNSLLAISSILVGLIYFGEWEKISYLQLFGITLALLGIIFMIIPQQSQS